MDDLVETADLLAFVRIAEAGSVSRAALELGLPRPTVSRRLAHLEERLGVRLIRRTTRRLALTDAGEELFPRARAVVTALRDVEATVRRDDREVRGLLRLSTPPLNEPLRSVLLAFLDRYPKVRVEVGTTSAHVDLLTSGYDVALRASAELDPGLVARQLVRTETIVVGAPDYLVREGCPTGPEELSRHRCLVGYQRGERPQTHWPLIGGGQVRVEARIATNDLGLLRSAALAGKGLAFLPRMLVADAIEQGTLVHVLPGRVGATTRLALVYAEREFLPPVVRAFLAFVGARAGEIGQAVPPPG